MTMLTNDTDCFNDTVFSKKYWCQHGKVYCCTRDNNLQNTLNGQQGDHIFRIAEVLLSCVLITVVGFFGAIGNVLNIIVLYQHGFKETTNTILMSLSISDLIFTVAAPITKLKCIFSLFDEALSITVHTFVTVVLSMPRYICLGSSFSFVSIIAIERFTAVFFPFHVSKIFSRSVTKLLIVFTAVISFLVMTPTFFTLKYEWVFDSRLNQTVAVIRFTEFYLNNQEAIDSYTWYGLNNCFCTSSMFIVTVCCIAISLKLWRAAAKRELMTTRANKYDVKVVKMLITVCLVYLSVAFPTISMYSYFVPKLSFQSSLHELVDNMCILLCTINSSANFLVYVTMSQKFADTYRRMIRCKIAVRKNPRELLSLATVDK